MDEYVKALKLVNKQAKAIAEDTIRRCDRVSEATDIELSVVIDTTIKYLRELKKEFE